ncbi:putative NFX1-type zinc finger-containing protein 1 [Apostichopus japonicus]|uniref:Putative NFX1-type zinc finger-containing protein 1 n=1 Tax=Stichopus japonicus TaxID=307972 RepID=A0A2G8LS56_STIJA|nr:putative NFX1-type zinc finger-containing protein 1 [Apostichopus japonicus]
MDEMEEREYAEANDVWKLTLLDRWRLYRCCLLKHQQNLQRSLEAAHRVILKEEVLRPFMTEEQRDSLDILRRNRNIQHGQDMAMFLCALGGQWTANELTRAAGFLNFDEIQNEGALIQMMTDYMRNDDSVCRMNVAREIMIYVAKGMVQIGPMSKYEAQNVRIVGQLPVPERWRLYKYWVSLYCAQLHECLEVSRTGILREEKIMPLMTAAQVASLQDESRNENIQNLDGGQLILLWLGAYSGVPIAVVQIVIDNLPEGEDEIDIFGEADIANEERYLEDENDEEMNMELENVVDYDEYENDGVDITRRSNTNDNEGWEVAGMNKRKLKRYVAKNLRRVDRMPFERAARVGNVWNLPMKQRWNLYRHWVHLHKESMQAKIFPLQEEYEKQAKLLSEARVEEDVEIIKDASIIALTTTGASKYHHLLQRAQPRIVVVEEAAEVLEAHIVTSLTENCQHLF